MPACGVSLLPLAAALIALLTAPAFAADPIMLTLKNNHFTPSAITVRAGERLRIVVKNEDATPAEFESSDLRVEKIVVGGAQISILVGPLKAGTYKFFDDYHPDIAHGTLTAVEKD